MKRVVAIAALVCALTGCGTTSNFKEGYKGQTQPYGGVRIAAANFGDDLVAVAMMWPFYAADVVFSAVGDTCTLPVTVSLAAWREGTRYCDLLFHYNEPPARAPEQNRWREFWFNDGPPPTRVEGGIY